MHYKEVIAASDEIVADIAVGPLGVDVGFLVEELLDVLAICQDDGCSGPDFEGVDAAIRLGPFGELKMGTFGWDLMQVADDWESGRTRWKVLGASADEEVGVDSKANEGDE